MVRRGVLARSRNWLLSRALRDEGWVLWLDADIVRVPPPPPPASPLRRPPPPPPPAHPFLRYACGAPHGCAQHAWMCTHC